MQADGGIFRRRRNNLVQAKHKAKQMQQVHSVAARKTGENRGVSYEEKVMNQREEKKMVV